MATYKKQLKDKNGNIIYPDVGIDLGNVVYSDDPTTPIGDVVNPFDYSTSSDVRVGSWDGKPLYRHIATITTPSNTYTFTNISTGISDADFAFIENGWVKSSEGWTQPINSFRASSDTTIQNYAIMCWVRLQSGYTNFAVSVAPNLTSQTAYISVLYTKSTD